MGGGGGDHSGAEPTHGEAEQGAGSRVCTQHRPVWHPGSADRRETGYWLPLASWIHPPCGPGPTEGGQGPDHSGAAEPGGPGTGAGADLPGR